MVNRFLKHTFSILLVFTYLTASLGIGVHECNSAGTKSVQLVFTKTICAPNHKHISCSSGGCHGKHKKKCCETEFYHLDRDYDVGQTNSYSHLISQVIALGVFSSDFDSYSLQPENIKGSVKLLDHPPPDLKQGTYSFHSQWRL